MDSREMQARSLHQTSGLNEKPEKFAGFTFWPDKWEAAAKDLPAETYKAYHLILCFMWRNSAEQCSIPNTEKVLSRATGLTGRRLQRVMSEILDPEFPLLKIEGNTLVSNGLRKEYEKCRENRARSRKGAEARYAPTDYTEAVSNADRQALTNADKTSKTKLSNSPKSKSRGLREESVVTLAGSILGEIPSPTQQLSKHFRSDAWKAWMGEVVRKLEATEASGVYDALFEIVDTVENATDPEKCAVKGEVPLKNPGRFIVSRLTKLCKRFKVGAWPDFPA